MKKLALLLCALTCTLVHAEKITDKELTSLNHKGNLELEAVNVTQSLNVDGDLSAEEMYAGTINVKGEAALSDVVVGKAANITGKFKAENSTFYGDINAQSETKLEKSGVRGKVNVGDRFKARMCQLGDLNVSGNAGLEGCIVNGKTRIRGNFSAEKGVFFDKISVEGEKAEFKQVVMKDIRVNGKELHLHEVVVTGDITFPKGGGTVYVRDVDLIGHIRGGKLHSADD